MARRGTWRALALTLGFAVPLGADQLLAAPPPTPPSAASSALPAPQGGGAIQLKVRRQADAVELVVEGTGAGPQLQQSTSANGWLGQLLIGSPGALRVGPQRLTIPELGFQSVSLEGSGSTYRLAVTPMPGVPLGRPVVSADGRNLIISFPASPQVSSTNAGFDINQPGRIPGQAVAPPLQPRAVAPPLGDMAVGTMTLRSQGYVNVSGPPVTMTLKEAPARDVLMTLARVGGFGFVYVPDAFGSVDRRNGSSPDSSQQSEKVSVSFRRESFSRAFNSVLLAAGFQARKDGNTVYAGKSVLSRNFGAQVSKVYRLNQVGPQAAADYLATLGAAVMRVDTITTSVSRGVSEGQQDIDSEKLGPKTVEEAVKATTFVEEYRATSGPLLGLRVTTDVRLGSVTLVGDPSVVAVAENYLRTLDLRQRQVALTLRILDIGLDNDAGIDNSFAIRWGNSFIVNSSGQLVGSFGGFVPPAYQAPGASEGPPPFSPAAGFSAQAQNPGLAYPANQFYDFLRAQIESRNTKVLASPTLILQENPSLLREGDAETAKDDSSQGGGSSVKQGVANISLNQPIGRRRANEGVVRVGTNVVTSYETNTTQGAISCTPELSTAGLVLGARVEKIDDNGFVTFTLSPSISAVVDTEPAPAGCGAPLNILSIRSLDTGALRVRDGQTLILTGVISDSARAEVRKWPVFGDLPVIGQFFRASSSTREKRELVIMATARVLNDDLGGGYGYGYRPSSAEARWMMSSDGRR